MEFENEISHWIFRGIFYALLNKGNTAQYVCGTGKTVPYGGRIIMNYAFDYSELPIEKSFHVKLIPFSVLGRNRSCGAKQGLQNPPGKRSRIFEYK